MQSNCSSSFFKTIVNQNCSDVGGLPLVLVEGSVVTETPALLRFGDATVVVVENAIDGEG